MSCDVCIDVSDGDNVEFFTRKSPKARKSYMCQECSEPIVAGARYVRVSGKCEGEMWEEVLCVPCDEIARAWYCGTVMYGNIWQDVQDTFDGLTSRSECFLKLSHSAKEHLMKFWWEWKARQ